ncbi:hypothetical protein L596_008287 [Steinernema carpocapsae]|uniref:Uncharacterized protein n=1 Tax=Steinernema carpocapsae TaxID=34508 RepID=A0A4U5PCJ2_STECR|nr:hypothetical protein L596_008287 [Steinernema carpocapsae]
MAWRCRFGCFVDASSSNSNLNSNYIRFTTNAILDRSQTGTWAKTSQLPPNPIIGLHHLNWIPSPSNTRGSRPNPFLLLLFSSRTVFSLLRLRSRVSAQTRFAHRRFFLARLSRFGSGRSDRSADILFLLLSAPIVRFFKAFALFPGCSFLPPACFQRSEHYLQVRSFFFQISLFVPKTLQHRFPVSPASVRLFCRQIRIDDPRSIPNELSQSALSSSPPPRSRFPCRSSASPGRQ